MLHIWRSWPVEIWLLLALAMLIGLIAGWLLWGRRKVAQIDTAEVDNLRADLATSLAHGRKMATDLLGVEADLAVARTAVDASNAYVVASVAAAKLGAAISTAPAPAPLAAMAAPVTKMP